MPFYHKLGELPPRRHITFYKPDGVSLYREELFSTRGFSGVYSNKYHYHIPPQVKEIKEIFPFTAKDWEDAPIQYYHFVTGRKVTPGNILTARQSFMRNHGCNISTAHVTEASH